MSNSVTRRLWVAGAALGCIGVATKTANAQVFGNRRPQNGVTDMAPTVLPNDVVRLERFEDTRVRVGDIIVYMHRRPSWDDRDYAYMKRIMALPGQRIAFRDGAPILDGVAAVSEYVTTEDLRYEAAGPSVHPDLRRYRETLAGRTYDTYHWSTPSRIMRTRQIHADGRETVRVQDIRNTDEIVVPDGHLFVAGDNRDGSEDSRWDGPISIAGVRRRAVAILSSPDPARVGLQI